MDNTVLLELKISEDDNFSFLSNLADATKEAELELHELDEQIADTEGTIKRLTPNCDKTDYALAAACGCFAGVIDIFLVGKPGESPVGDITDKWFEERTKDFAKLCGWSGDNDSKSSAIRYLGKVFKVPYDQRGAGDAARQVFDIKPMNHHFKSLAHNPTILGLVFSIMDQFSDPTTSHFITDGDLISLQDADNSFKLKGKTVPGKFFCAFINWFGHLISDVSGSESSKGRGMGIPSSFGSWTNSIIAIKRALHLPVFEFEKNLNELALTIYKKGYDFRFQTAQAIPVFINELLVRFIYSVRRMIMYYRSTEKHMRSFSLLWKTCEPFTNASVKRMLTVAHGTFCIIDLGDAIVRGFVNGKGHFNPIECLLRINMVGIGRFTISLYGEAKRHSEREKNESELYYIKRKRVITEDYIKGLNILSEIYDDRNLLSFVDDLKDSNLYKQAFEKTVVLAHKRNAPEELILKDKKDIDEYFTKGGGH